ncbi:hypothetical protein [Pelagovum pacificum]|uniref:Uncharacterized protein n=1 Tax=Pelagovum pacificum TaxID=2588711 RepID=A0A5C5GA42_9RHOB|nr:hypothetical protein [Pelagovum pacificum]QQA41626.1 hypothetical protein I8N54_12445 [Pelagovum pacificum]TNY30905.1 hypothetical protein FHY64_17520 [Pelagovum pacificum]
MRHVILLGAMAASAATAEPSTIAEVICAPTPEMMTRLTIDFRATREAIGLRDHEQMMEIWTDAQGGWTMVASYASGRSCIVAMGVDWQTLSGDDAS